MMNPLKTLSVLGLSAIVSLNLLASAQQQLPPHVAGKVANVSHEKVKVGESWLDKISVTVESCQTPGQLKTVHYTPGTDSDRTALGHLFEEDVQSARTANMVKQKLPNGFAVFWIDQANKVLRTGILGSKMDCRVVPSILQQF